MRRLGELESVVMNVLWDGSDSATVRDVREVLERDRPVAYTTVMTVLDHLHGKGMVRRERDGRAYRYQPVTSREEYHADLMADVLSGSSDQAATLLHFVDRIDPGQLAEMRRALAAAQRRAGRR
ncbi:BlaI/MecI/CopY family transcriptional regulator [Actinocatenispora rupis]|uniref:Penicillinase repressor n=1 Tax=Actinocatenispora rupis TaxID=519421 RepID=A0A8J3IWS3_9ACTN|nr:BlaI/MecI/CopY family transcriptional regulator [Actinocatenispora rupis]GID10103.1 penicillinase repressor [Actinocatenispora rupis]